MDIPPGKSPQKAVDALDAEMERLQSRRLTAAELGRAKNILRGLTLRSLATHSGKANSMGEHELLFGSWRALLNTLDRYEQVTAEQVQQVARKHFVSNARSIVELVPDASVAPQGV
jgi:predicted Zn-dependent peptidase